MASNTKGKSRVYVVSAPSAAGKTTLDRMLAKKHPQVEISVSLTTRAKREGEQHGVHYWFVTAEEFERTVKNGRMLETALVHGNSYGTCLDEIDRIHAADHIPLLEIDVHGWVQARQKLPDACGIFILAPSMAALWKRLETRGSDSIEVRRRRMKTARTELEAVELYEYFIVNDDLDKAFQQLESIIVHGKSAGISREEALKLRDAQIDEYERSFRDR